jgi:hypothetical protein
MSADVAFCFFGELFNGSNSVLDLVGLFSDGVIERLASDWFSHLNGEGRPQLSVDFFLWRVRMRIHLIIFYSIIFQESLRLY